MTLELPREKRQKIQWLVETFSRKRGCKIRDFAQFIGNLISCCPALEYSLAYVKNFEREKFLALVVSGGDYDASMVLPEYLHRDFSWWKSRACRGVKSIKSPRYAREIFSGASLTGWGAYCNNEGAHGFWKKNESSLHINYLELMAAFIAIKCFAADLNDCEVLLRVDNTTAIAYVNHMGGIQYPRLSKIAKAIWQWCELRGIRIFASYISSESNKEADRESRVRNMDTECELAGFAFREITQRFGVPDIDLFASRVNTKWQAFCSWHRDPDAFAINAFTINWNQWFFFGFPPFALIPRVLQKIRSERAHGILVVPYWPNQPWFPVFLSCLAEEPIHFGPSNKLLISPCRSVNHPLAGNLVLTAGRLSGSRLSGKTFQVQQPISSSLP